MAIGSNSLSDTLTRTYNSHSGCDIVATINGVVLGNLNGISFSTTREKAPIYTLGNVDAVAFGRGKRGHAGSLIFTNFDRHVLYDVKRESEKAGKPLKYYAKGSDIPAGGRSFLLGTQLDEGDLTAFGNSRLADPNYSDQLPPFTITLTGQNEYGNTSVMSILGVELINEGSGISIDDIVTETQMTFVARALLTWRPIIGGDLRAFEPQIVGEQSPLAAIRSAWAAQRVARAAGEI
tara:strand:- start:153 stop:860 length:708 start_codon:yes stop_codon:yes gene_type:complete